MPASYNPFDVKMPATYDPFTANYDPFAISKPPASYKPFAAKKPACYDPFAKDPYESTDKSSSNLFAPDFSTKVNPYNSTQFAGLKNKTLIRNIEFEPAGSYQSTVLDKLKSKYIVLKNSDVSPQASKPDDDDDDIDNQLDDESRKLACKELYPLEAVQLGWNKCDWVVGAGMINMGNTCYLNSTLQALFHVPALVNWLISDKEHMAKCQDSGVLCIICAMRKTLQDSQQRNSTTIRPLLIFNKLRLVCRTLIPGRQEDAHEFLRCLIEAMEKSYLNRFKNHSEFEARVKETTPLNQILGGYLHSAVQCLKCNHVSTTLQHFQDLMLDIRKVQTLDEALEAYFSREKLDEDSYHCQSCQKKVPATKQFSLERTPMVLCIQLKRFSISNNKITKHINFRQRLDLTRYARHRTSVPLIYRLVALVTHMGPTVNCGHYTAVAQAPSGTYYQFDDSMVRNISLHAVFNTNAYIMLYELESSSSLLQNIKTNKSIVAVNNNNNNNTDNLINNNIINNNGSSLSPIKQHLSNGVGFTSDKVYGPELPPEKQEKKKLNGNSTSSSSSSIMLTQQTKIMNGNGNNGKQHLIIDNNNNSSSSTSDSSDSDEQVVKQQIVLQNKKETKSMPLLSLSSSSSSNDSNNNINNNNNKNNHNNKNNNNSTNNNNGIKQPSSKLILHNNTNNHNNNHKSQTVTKLVPYETDTSGSEESNHSAHTPIIIDPSRVSTKAAVGDWKVTSSSDLINNNNNNKDVSCAAGGGGWMKKTPQSDQNPPATVVNELYKMSHRGYAEPVASWNGTRAHLDKEISCDRREDRKRALSIGDDMDEGRVKHKKIHHNNNYKSNAGYNPIQEFHNSKNWSQNNSNNNNGHYNKHNYFNNKRRRMFHNKPFRKNYRSRQ